MQGKAAIALRRRTRWSDYHKERMPQAPNAHRPSRGPKHAQGGAKKQKPRIVPEFAKLDGRGGTPNSTRTRRQAGARRLEQARRGGGQAWRPKAQGQARRPRAQGQARRPTARGQARRPKARRPESGQARGRAASQHRPQQAQDPKIQAPAPRIRAQRPTKRKRRRPETQNHPEERPSQKQSEREPRGEADQRPRQTHDQRHGGENPAPRQLDAAKEREKPGRTG